MPTLPAESTASLHAPLFHSPSAEALREPTNCDVPPSTHMPPVPAAPEKMRDVTKKLPVAVELIPSLASDEKPSVVAVASRGMLPGVPEPSKPAFGHSVMHEAPMQKPASARIRPAVNTLLSLYERTHVSSDMYQPPPQFCQYNPPLPLTRK